MCLKDMFMLQEAPTTTFYVDLSCCGLRCLLYMGKLKWNDVAYHKLIQLEEDTIDFWIVCVALGNSQHQD